MPIQKTYKTGTITVVSGSATVTGTGTFFTAGLVNGGELSFRGFSIPIAAVASETSLTLDYPAPAGMAGTGVYSIALGRADAASAIEANRQLSDLLQQVGAGLVERVSAQITAIAPGLIPSLLPPGLNDLLQDTIEVSDAARDQALSYRDGVAAAKTAIDTLLVGSSLDALVGPVCEPTLHQVARQGDLPEGLVFSRNSIATRINAKGLLETVPANKLRVDYDPVTGARKGWLIEEARKNLFLYSGDFSASWNFAGVARTSAAAPDGSLSAALFTEITGSTIHGVGQFVAGTTAANYVATISVFLKKKDRPHFALTANGEGSGLFDLDAGTASGQGNVVATIAAFHDGWFRCTAKITRSGAGSSEWYLLMCDTPGNLLYNGNGTSGIYVWGAQLEAGAAPSSYIPTTSAAVTRDADIFSMNIASLNNNAEGTLYIEASTSRLGTGVLSLTRDGSDGGPRIQMSTSGTSPISVEGAVVDDAEVVAVAGGAGGAGVGRTAMRWRRNDFGISTNGQAVLVDPGGEVPTNLAVLRLGYLFGNMLNGTIKRVAYFPRALSDADLRVITNPAFQWDRYART